jgi:hypothetical protein
MTIQPPEWMLTAARNAVKASGVNLEEAFAARIHDARNQAEAGSKQHQDITSLLTKKMTELRPKPVIIPTSTNTFDHVPIREPARVSTASTVLKRAMRTPDRNNGNNRRSESMRKSESRRGKKVKFHIDQARPVEKKHSSPTDTASQTGKTTSTTAVTSPDPMGLNSTLSNALVPQGERYTIPTSPPQWYTAIEPKSMQMRNLSKKRPEALTTLHALQALVRQCEEAPKQNRSSDLPILYDKLRDSIHKAEVTITVTPHILRKANMLSDKLGLPRIFAPKARFPADIKADSYQLYKRWYAGNLTQDMLRGIISKKANNRASDSICPVYRSQFPLPAKYIGQAADLVLGQWWPTQLCAVRDGAHGSPQGGISGSKEHGAYSIVLSGGHGYADTDNGDTILYCGTENPTANGVPTENTKHMLTSCETQSPVRVIRSSQLNKANRFRPERGLRYDGLYRVTGYEVLDKKRAVYRFRLERCEGQQGIRYEGAARRPTVYEVREYERLKREGAW